MVIRGNQVVLESTMGNKLDQDYNKVQLDSIMRIKSCPNSISQVAI